MSCLALTFRFYVRTDRHALFKLRADLTETEMREEGKGKKSIKSDTHHASRARGSSTFISMAVHTKSVRWLSGVSIYYCVSLYSTPQRTEQYSPQSKAKH